MLGERIRKFRLDLNMAPVHLADRCGVSKKTVEAWENGTREPKIADLILLADVFKISLDKLVGRDVELS